MPFSFAMPKLSPTMTEGTVAKWHKNVGDYVDSGDLVVEIATDKATIESHAVDPGWLRVIIVEEGGRADVGKPIAVFSEKENTDLEGFTPHQEVLVKEEPIPTTPFTAKEELKTDRVIASPLAKKIAAKEGIRLETVKGSGPRGRILSRDLKTVQQFPVKTEHLSPMRQAIAKKMQYAKATIPHFYLGVSVEASALIAFREKLKNAGEAVTINDLIVRASALALMDHPRIRSSFLPEEQVVQQHPHADIAVAVSVPGGLITPIVPSAETKSFKVISSEIKALTERARAGKLQPQEYTGGAFTISNLGMFGIEEFFAIINPPQVAILSVGAALDAPIFKGGGIAPGKCMKVTLSVDHRAVDGADGAAFLKTLKGFLEQPLLLQ